MQDLFAEQLKALRAASLDRHLFEISSPQGPEITVVGRDRRTRRLINFSSNDYLGLANDPRLREAAISALQEFGVGAGASRLISGTQPPHVRLERALAEWKGTEAALCFSSGYAAALGSIPALVTKNDVVLLDKLCHADRRRKAEWRTPAHLSTQQSAKTREPLGMGSAQTCRQARSHRH